MTEDISWIVNRRLRSWILLTLGIAMISIPMGELFAATTPMGEEYPLLARAVFLPAIPFCIVPIYVFPFPKKVGFSTDKIHLSYLYKKRNRAFEIKEIKQISLLEEMNKVTGFRIILNDDKGYAVFQVSSEIVNKIKEIADQRKIIIKQTTYRDFEITRYRI